MTNRVGFKTIVAALCALAVLPAAASAQPCVTALSCGAGLNAMLDLEAKAVDHMHAGYMTPADFATAAQVPGQVVGHTEYYDAGLWTGVYGAGEAFRYATAKKWLATPGLTGADYAFWAGQKSEALTRVKAIVEMYDRNVNIAGAYKGSLKIPPSIAAQDPTHLIDAGQIISGEKGMLMRSCTEVGDPVGIGNQDSDAQVGPLRWKDGKDYTCLDNTSRDTYAGTLYGLLTIFDLVSVDEPAMRHQITANVLALGNVLVKYGWFMPHPWNNGAIGTEFVDYFFPLFIYSPGPQMNVAASVRHVVDLDGGLLDRLKWDALETTETALFGPTLPAETMVDALTPNDSYFKWNLGHIVFFNLNRMLPPLTRAFIPPAVAAMDKGVTGDDMNAHFQAIIYSMTGEPARRDAAISYLQQWLQYRQNTSGGAFIQNSVHCGDGSLRCVPEDYVELSLDGGAHRFTLTPGNSTVCAPTRRCRSPTGRRRTSCGNARRASSTTGSRPTTGRQASTTCRPTGCCATTPRWLRRHCGRCRRISASPATSGRSRSLSGGSSSWSMP